MHCVDLGESFPTSIYLQRTASIQPRTSLSKFAGKFNSIFIRLLRRITYTTDMITEDIAPLAAAALKEIKDQVEIGTKLTWESERVEQFTAKLDEMSFILTKTVRAV